MFAKPPFKLAPAGQFGSVGTLKNSATDTTANYLSSKLVAGGGIVLTTLNPGGNEQEKISGGVGAGTLVLKNAAFNIAAADNGSTFVITAGTFGIGFASSATLGQNFAVSVINIGTGTATLTPNAGTGDKIFLPGGGNAGDASTTIPYSGAAAGPYNISGLSIIADGLTSLIALTSRESHGCQPFTVNGNFTVPAGVTTVWLTGVGAGGGGSGTIQSQAGGGGASGFAGYKIPITVVPGTVVAVGIGVGGAGGVAGANPGVIGGNTTFGALQTFLGGNPGAIPTGIFGLGGSGGINGGNTFSGSGRQAFSGVALNLFPSGGSAPFFCGSYLQGNSWNGTGAFVQNQAGLHPGQGGDGAASATVGGALAGGAGANGMLIVEW